MFNWSSRVSSGLLLADVFPDHRPLSTAGRDEVSPGPELLPHEVALPLSIDPCKVDSALALDVPDHLRHRIFGRDRYHHVNMVGHQMPLFDPALLLYCQSAEHFPEMLPQFPVQRLPAALGNEDHMIFALPFAVA